MQVLEPDRAVQLFDHPNDVKRVVRAFLEHNYFISANAAFFAWERFSYGSEAGWLSLDNFTDSDIVAACMPYLKLRSE